jgi:acetolactate synthase-1/2/3 large subunit
VPYFPEPAEQLLAGTRHLVLVESAAPVSFFGYPNRRSYLAPGDAAVHVLASPEQDGAAALAALADLATATSPALVQTAGPDALPDTSAPLTPETIAAVVAHLLPEGAIVSDEAISSAEPLGRHLLHAAPHDLLPVTGGSIGQGLPVAVGAAVACPHRKVIAMEADGSAMYTLQALWTMARERLDVTVVIYNNRRYRILDVEMRRTGANGFGPVANDMIDIGRPDLDFVKLSEGLGVPATRAATAGELADQFALAMRERGPRLIEAVC